MNNQTELSNAVTLALGNIPNREDEAVQALESLPDTVEGLMDLGYKFAKVRASASALALKAADMIPGFPENVADEHKAKVIEGYRLHKSELDGARWYKRDGFDAYTEVLESDVDHTKPNEYMRADVGYAFSYSQQEYGALKAKQPNLHRILGEIRKDVNKYCSNTWNGLIATYKALFRATATRAANATFYQKVAEMFEEMRKKRKVAATREGSDEVPTEAALNKAIAAFNKAL